MQPVFLSQQQAIDYATGRACFRSGEIRILDSNGADAGVGVTRGKLFLIGAHGEGFGIRGFGINFSNKLNGS